MCAEVDKGICLEAELCPQIRGYVGVRGSSVRAVYNLESIVAFACRILWQQDYVAELQACHSQPSVLADHVVAGKLAECIHHFGIPFGADGPFHPLVILLLVNQLRVSGLHKTVESPFGIGAEYGALRLDHLCQSVGRGGKSVYLESLALHAYQQVVERRRHFHASGCQGILSCPFVIVDGNPLFAVRLALQGNVAVDGLDKSFQPFGDGKGVLQAFLVEVMPEKGIRTDGTVNLWRDNALRQESAAHAHLVCFPLFYQSVDIQRAEKWNVLLCQIVYHVVAHPSVCHVDDCRGAYGVGHVPPDKRCHCPYGIDHVSGLFEPSDQVGGFAHLPRYDDGGSSLFPQSVPLQKCLIVGNCVEACLFVVRTCGIAVVDQVVRACHYSFRLMDREELAVYLLADIVQHAPVVAPPAVSQILHQCIHLYGIQRDNPVLRIGDGRTQYGHASLCRFPDQRTLFFRDAQSHGIDKYHVVLADSVEFIGAQLADFDERIVVRL